MVVESPQAGEVIDIRNQAFASDLSVGAGSGAIAGGLWGLSCGPWAPLCIPLGAALGAMSGGVAGAAVGVTGALSAENSARLRERLIRVQASHDLRQELRKSLADRAGKRWSLDSERPAFTVTVELQDLSLTSTRDDRIGLVMRARVSVRPRDANEKTPVDRKEYDHVGPLSPLAVWLDDQNDFLDTSLSNATAQFAAQIVSELALN